MNNIFYKKPKTHTCISQKSKTKKQKNKKAKKQKQNKKNKKNKKIDFIATLLVSIKI